MADEKWKQGVHEHVIEQLLSKDWGELEVLEHADYLLFPDKVYRREKGGGFEEIDVVLRVPRENEFRKARVQARVIGVADGMDVSVDADLFENLENLCLLSVCIRNAKPPHEPWCPDPKVLERKYDRVTLSQIWAKIDKLNGVVNPAPDNISKDETYALMAALAKERHLGPLAVYGSGAQTSFILFMVDVVMSSLDSKSSSEQSEPSTPAALASTA